MPVLMQVKTHEAYLAFKNCSCMACWACKKPWLTGPPQPWMFPIRCQAMKLGPEKYWVNSSDVIPRLKYSCCQTTSWPVKPRGLRPKHKHMNAHTEAHTQSMPRTNSRREGPSSQFQFATYPMTKMLPSRRQYTHSCSTDTSLLKPGEKLEQLAAQRASSAVIPCHQHPKRLMHCKHTSNTCKIKAMATWCR
jgi:hypothetical protein